MSKVAVDGDTICYKACFATQYNVYRLEEEGQEFRYHKDTQGFLTLNFDEDERPEVTKVEVIEPITHTYYLLDTMLESIRKDLNVGELTIFLSGSSDNNYRYRIPYPQGYKSGRPEKPKHLDDARSYLIRKYNASVTDGYEADDALGIFASAHNSSIIASVDKDLRMIPGRHFHLDHRTLTIVTESDGMRNFYTQMLTGDRVDNILGVKGCGPKTAEKLLNNLLTQADMERVVREKYKECYGEEADQMFRSTFDLLWILRSTEEYEEVKKYYEALKRETEGQTSPANGEGLDNQSVQSASG